MDRFDRGGATGPAAWADRVSRRRLGQLAAAGGAAAALARAGLGRAAAQDALSGSVDFWHLSSPGFQDGVYDDAAKRLMAKYPDVKVTVQALQNDPFKTKLAVAMGSDSPPDVWHTWGGGVLAEYVKAGEVLDLTDALAKDGWGDRFAPSVLNLTVVDGKHYGVPLNASGVFFWYNKELFAQNGLTPPTSWDELLKLVEALKAKGIIPIALGNKTKWPGAFYLNYMALRVAGEQFLGDVLAGKTTFSDPAFVASCQRVVDLAAAGAFNPGFNGVDWDTGGSRQLLYAGKAAMELMGNWLLSTVAGESKGFEQKLDFFAVPVPPDGKGDASSLVGGAGTSFAASQKSKAPAAATELLRFLTDDTVRDAFAAGGEVPAIKGATIDNPMTAKIAEAFNGAKFLQLYWDQYLPPALGQAQLDVSQALLAQELSPEDAGKKMDEALKGGA